LGFEVCSWTLRDAGNAVGLRRVKLEEPYKVGLPGR
jgi:hypothetical protein